MTALYGAQVIDWTGRAICKSPYAVVSKPAQILIQSTADWLAAFGISGNSVVLYKRVSAEFATQEDRPYKTVWTPGKTLEHPDWSPTNSECGAGKYHACPIPALCDQFRSKHDDRYIAIKVAAEDLFAWTDNPQYPSKIAFRKCTVLYECDRNGNEVKS